MVAMTLRISDGELVIAVATGELAEVGDIADALRARS